MVSVISKFQGPDALTAVAFQDHLLRSMNLSLSTAISSKPNLNKRLAYRKPKGKSLVDCHRVTKESAGIQLYSFSSPAFISV